MVLRCRDTGGWCNWQGHADTEEELIEMALRHAKQAHWMEPTLELKHTARRMIRRG